MKKSIVRSEFKAIFRNKKLLIPIIAVLFIPVLYAGMFLWSFWDPYEQLSDLPVAVVNSDDGAEFDGKDLHIGDDLVDKLKDSSEFEFHFVDKEEGYKNLEKQEYYMLVEIPEDFSENGTTLLEDRPQKLSLKYVPNESFNFLSAQIGDTAMKEIKASLSKSVSQTYAETMFEKIQVMGDGFQTASDKAGEINNGAIDLSQGADKLKDNLAVLAEKNVELTGGVAQVQSGATDLAKGSKELSDGVGVMTGKTQRLYKGTKDVQAGIDSLAAGIDQSKSGLEQVDTGLTSAIENTSELHAGSKQLAEKIGALKGGAESAKSGAQTIGSGAAELENELAPLMESLPEEKQKQIQSAINQIKNGATGLEKGTDALSTGASELQGGANKLAGSIGALNDGQKQLQGGVDQLVDGSIQLDQGSEQLQAGQNEIVKNVALLNGKLNEVYEGTVSVASGASELNAGINKVYDGSTQLTDGSKKLAEGSQELAEGSTKLSNGTTEYESKLKSAAEEANSVKANDDTYDMMAAPVDVKNEKINHVPNYGTGFAPYFLSLGLFVGALLISIVFPLKDPASRPSSGLSWFLGKFAVLTTVGIIQSLIAVGILLFGLGLEVESVPLFILTTIVTSLTFLALIQMLVTLMGDPGRFVAIIILILQLTTSAGTFPLELIPTVLQPISAMLPMTYSVSAFKAVISSGDFDFMWQNVLILLGYLIVFIAMTSVFLVGLFKKQYIKTVEA
ncbi:YhgE/Pip domain-containing protein [Pseudalkalibacillus berkeleyi]|uniref:YhgE/Pip domain-containing protein n=1 Tax=Pseudalkalibacillus berkeleyi TaxID=1069813 RepID=A0ABS9GYJ7_9BACL|nr:YhgE/Pip domain-containing protein [Pseudalkalibacillus berkeleyi]MCF6137818.1 YhgE/Pip domain-containing protein [Pseudalkalibacillus berkeleyi]